METQRAGWRERERQPGVAWVPSKCAGCWRQRQMRRKRCPWRKGRGQVPRSPHPARTALLGRSCLQEESFRPPRTPLRGSNLLLASKSLCPIKTLLVAKSPLQAQKPQQGKTPYRARGLLQPQNSPLARTSLLIRNLHLTRTLQLAKTSLQSQSPLPRPLHPVKIWLPASALCPLRPLLRRPCALET